jgi:hypothetical protein
VTDAPAPRSLNLELLIKLLKLTASSNDAEALLAMRKAHEVLAKFGGDWEALLHSKVTVIADPFTAAAKPPEVHHSPPPPRPHPKPATPTPMHQAAPQHTPFVSPQQARQARYQATWQAQQRMKAAASAAAQTPTAAPTRNTLRKQRISLDDLA